MYEFLISSSLIYGLIIVSGILGAATSFFVYLLLVWATGTTIRLTLDREWWYTGFLTGVFERIFFTSIIGLLGTNGSGAATAMIAWIAVKVQAHYNIFSRPDKQEMPRVYLGLLGSLGSLLLAVLGGYFWYNGHAWAHPWTGTRV
jgi:hypothetical protein